MFFRTAARVCTAAFISTGVAVNIASAQALTDAPPVIAGARAASAPAIVLDGPPAPVAPAVVNRDDKGRATLRATRIVRPLTIDGRLDEEVYVSVPGAGDFVQQLPRESQPATEATLFWVFFDDKNLYISARCLDSHPEREVATELRRDNNNIIQNENITITLDTFYDRRNGFLFQTSALGAIRDQSVADGTVNVSWNTVWDVKSARDSQGWTTEMVIPFKSLRYAGSGPQVWGINVRRITMWKNEADYLSAVPAAYGNSAVYQMNVGGTLVGVETPLQSMNLELKPYVVSSLNTDRAAARPYSNDFAKNGGFDFKYGLTRGLVLDATVNTDFAQVEEDAQQVNLTRFSLFFPEKRDFFLEGEGIFGFGGAAVGERSGNGTVPEVPILFFSRQIGLSNGQPVPVRTGARVTGRAGEYSIGMLNIETAEKSSASAAATNFSVLRVKRDILRRSTIGVLATRRAPSVTIAGRGSNYAGGFDANLGFFDSVDFIGYYAKTGTPGVRGTDRSYRGRFDYGADRVGVQLEHIAIGSQFNPEVGYVKRGDFRRTFADFRFSQRTRKSRRIRRLNFDTSLDYIENDARTVVQNKEQKAAFSIEFHNSDQFKADYRTDYELLPRDFAIATGVTVPRGGYQYGSFNTSYSIGQQRMLSGQVSASVGTFYEGTKRSLGFNNAYLALNRRIAFEPGVALNWVDLPYGSFTARLITNRTIITPTPRMLISSLVQYNGASHALSTSVRLNWEYQPSSQFFVVYSDGRDTLGGGMPDLLNRSFAIKITRLLRF